MRQAIQATSDENVGWWWAKSRYERMYRFLFSFFFISRLSAYRTILVVKCYEQESYSRQSEQVIVIKDVWTIECEAVSDILLLILIQIFHVEIISVNSLKTLYWFWLRGYYVTHEIYAIHKLLLMHIIIIVTRR